MILSIDEYATYTCAGIEYKLAGLYFKPVSDAYNAYNAYNDCMTDFVCNPIAYIHNRKMNTSFNKQPKMAIKVVPKYNVAYKANGKGIWHVTDIKYETIEEFMSDSQYCVPCHLLKD